jgi:hypothetical protein
MLDLNCIYTQKIKKKIFVVMKTTFCVFVVFLISNN